MYKGDLQSDAGAVIERPSVQFNSDLKYQGQQAWPYWYNFVPWPYLNTDELNGGLGLQGFRIPAGGIQDIPIVLDRDTAFRLINVKYSVFRDHRGAELTGTITPVAGTTAMVGIGTAFDTELSAGQSIMWIDTGGNWEIGTVASVTNATNLVLQTAPAVGAAGVVFFRRDLVWYDTVPNQQVDPYTNLTGTLSIAAGGNAVVGVGTLFVAEVNVGDVIYVQDDAGVNRRLMVSVVTDNLNINVTETMSATVGVTGATAFVCGLILPSGGTATLTTANNLITGVGTDFVTDLVVGDYLYYPDATGVVQAVRVDSIVSTTIAKFTTGGATASGAGVNFAIGLSSNNAIQVPRNLFTYYPLTEYVRVTLSFPSLNDRYSYGGLQHYLINNQGLQERPRRIGELQGSDDGLGMLRTPALLPYDGIVNVRVRNNYSEPVIVNGALFGYKIALDLKEHSYD